MSPLESSQSGITFPLRPVQTRSTECFPQCLPQSDPVQILQRFKHFHCLPLQAFQKVQHLLLIGSLTSCIWDSGMLWEPKKGSGGQWNSGPECRRRLRRSAHVNSLGKCLYTTCSKEVSFYQPPNTQNGRCQRIQSKLSSMIMRSPGCKKMDMWSWTSGGEPHSHHIWYLTGCCNTKGKFKRLSSSGPVPGLTMISVVFSSTFCCHFWWNQSLVSPGLAKGRLPPFYIAEPVAVHEWQALLFATTCSSCFVPYDFNDTRKTDQVNQEDIFTSVLWSLYVHNSSEKKMIRKKWQMI